MKHTIEIDGLPEGYNVESVKITHDHVIDGGIMLAVVNVKKKQPRKKQRRNLHDPMRFAEGLIEQLPDDHEGAINWLMNNGDGDKADNLRKKYGQPCPRRIILEETVENNTQIDNYYNYQCLSNFIIINKQPKIWRIVEDSGDNDEKTS